MAATTLFEIPEEVFETGVFPLLSVNDILRIRRVCRWTTGLSNEYLRLHPRSKKVICLDLSAMRKKNEWHSLQSFLRQDAISSIPMPTSHFMISFENSPEMLRHPLFTSNFLRKYGKQIKHLDVSVMTSPMSDEELNFYEQLPNLRRLGVENWIETTTQQMDNKECIPETFKKLKKLQVDELQSKKKRLDFEKWKELHELRHLWNLIKFCSNLEFLQLPSPKAHPAISNKGAVLAKFNLRQLRKLQTILDLKQHEQLRRLQLCLDFEDDDFELPPEKKIRWIEVLYELSSKHDVKLDEFPMYFFGELEERLLRKIAPHVVSLPRDGLWENFDFEGIVFPNVEQISGMFNWLTNMPTGQLGAVFMRSSFPSLKKLDLELENGNTRAILGLEYLWLELTQLEELSLERPKPSGSQKKVHSDDDKIFLGSGILAVPALLQLTKLKKLTVGKGVFGNLTDAVFFRVLRHMQLRELHLKSHGTVRVTSAGIRTLLTGPFWETIMKFPFREWKVADLNAQEFQKLAEQFPNNRLLGF